MIDRRFAAAVAGLLVALGLACSPQTAAAEDAPTPQWVWFNEGNPAQSAPAETRYFRRVVEVEKAADAAELEITADNSFTVWVNGAEVGQGNEWQRVFKFDVKKLLVAGKNVVAVEAANESPGPAGLMARLSYVPGGQAKQFLVTDGKWKASKTAAEGWRKLDFDEKGWEAAKVLGPFGKTPPWNASGAAAAPPSGPERFSVPEGFKVETVIPPVPSNYPVKDGKGAPMRMSLVNMTFDAKGRLLVSQEGGPVVLCTNPGKDGVLQDLKPYCEQVRNCQGMCWVKDALLLVGDGPKGTGLYRVRDTNGDDRTDEVTLLHQFKGGMGEHGPHAVLHGPDGWLYLVIGNHAWANIGPEAAKNGANPEKLADNSPLRRWPTGGMGPDQGKPKTTEDVLLPRLNDAHGHAANILAPGGTIWRLDLDGKNMSLVAAGFRNEFDAAFSPTGELFTFDSDMEWDEALPWYRAVRVCHCPPGADFVWRTGAANTPEYYIDSLPPIYETGRGSPVGVEFYDADRFPEKYRGCFFMADWSLGIIYAVHLERDGASYKPTVEKFCTGTPMNVTDTAVGPDGALYFSLGGRGSAGGVYRITCPERPRKPNALPFEALWQSQPLAAFSRAALAEMRKESGAEWLQRMPKIAADAKEDLRFRLRAIDALANCSPDETLPTVLMSLMKDDNPEVRAHATYRLGVAGAADEPARKAYLTALQDTDPLVRRRACEALIRAGVEPPARALVPLLGDKNRFVRTAARLVLQRIDPAKWATALVGEANDVIAYEAIVALCKEHRAQDYANAVWKRLHDDTPDANGDVTALLNYLRCVELALIHTTVRGDPARGVAADVLEEFPHKDSRVNRELAIILTELGRSKILGPGEVVEKLVAALEKAAGDKQQQIHYFYCLRLLKEGWKPEQKKAVAEWYDSTKSWTGGFSYTPFLENIFRECLDAWTVADRKQVLEDGVTRPLPALVLAQKLQTDKQAELLPALNGLLAKVKSAKGLPREKELQQALNDAIARTALADASSPEGWANLVKALNSDSPVVLFDVIAALKKSPIKPKPEDAAPFRAVLLATQKLDEKSRWKGIELLRHWTGDKRFGAEEGDWKKELPAWARWFAQTFPKEPSLPIAFEEKPAESKYKFDELLAFLEKDPAGKKGDPAKGRAVFEKGQCIKCHKYGSVGEGIGPDLTTLSKRFKRADMLESLIYPSKVISDQYRSTTVVTQKGQQFTGLLAVQGGMVVILQQDGTKVMLKEDDIADRFASLISTMPERLLDPLTREEIADLFAFLESDPPR